MKHLLLKMCYKNSKVEVIWGITIDNKLNFDNHMKKMRKICLVNQSCNKKFVTP